MNSASPVTAHLTIAGMTCASCVRSVTEALAGVPGVSEASVNFSAGVARVSYDPLVAGPEAMIEAVRRSGYQASLRPDPTAEAVPAPPAADASGSRRLAVSVLLSIPIVALGMFGPALGVHDLRSLNPLLLVLTIPVQFWCAAPILRAAGRNLRHRRAEMNVLVSLGTLSAFTFSAGHALARTGEHVHFDSAAAIVTLVLVGRALEGRARARTTTAIRALMDLRPRTARVVRRGAELDIPATELRVHDLVIVRPGERVPADGRVVEGATTIDESMLTGEAFPVAKGEGSVVTGGTVNQAGAFRLRVTRIGADTTLARIIALVSEAQESRAPIERLVDRIAAVFVPVVLATAVVTLTVWLASGRSFPFALTAAVSVLIIACPCALGLATPTALTVGIGRAAHFGILVRDAEHLERAGQVDVLAFDKTGTLTVGRPEVTDVLPAPGISADALVAAAAAIEAASTHPLAAAVTSEARRRGLDVPAGEGVTALPGRGLRGRTAEGVVHLGSRQLCADLGVDPGALAKEAERLAAGGRSCIFVTAPSGLLGLIAVADPLKPTALPAVRALRALGLETVLLTGDSRLAAEFVARDAGIERVVAELAPEGKAQEVRRLQACGIVVAMAGDGINDAPALAQADVSFSMGGGTDVAIAAAGFTLLHGDLTGLAQALLLSRRTLATIRQNLFWAFAYNVLSIPVAAGVLYPLTGHLLHPILAAAAMSFSSLTVVLNSLRLAIYTPGIPRASSPLPPSAT